jgi:hypothetical protein
LRKKLHKERRADIFIILDGVNTKQLKLFLQMEFDYSRLGAQENYGKKGNPRSRLLLARIVSAPFIISSGLAAIGGIVWLCWTANFVFRAARATGTIIKMEESKSSEGTKMYSPVYTFADAAGTTYTEKASLASSTSVFAAGEKVTVLYDPDSPKRSNIDSFSTLWLGPAIFTGGGTVGCGFSCFWLWMATRSLRKQQQ